MGLGKGPSCASNHSYPVILPCRSQLAAWPVTVSSCRFRCSDVPLVVQSGEHRGVDQTRRRDDEANKAEEEEEKKMKKKKREQKEEGKGIQPTTNDNNNDANSSSMALSWCKSHFVLVC